MGKAALFNRIIRIFAPDAIRALYRGILGREPDETGLVAYVNRLKLTGRLDEIAKDIATSGESWSRHLVDNPRELKRLMVLGLMDHEDRADDDVVGNYPITGPEDLPEFLARASGSTGHWRRILAERSDDISREVLLGLGAESEDHATVREHAASLIVERNLATLVARAARSDAHWTRLLQAHTPELMAALLRGLTEPSPGSGEPGARTSLPPGSADFVARVVEAAHSPDHWNHLLAQRAEDLVTIVYRGLLGRDPDPEGMATYTAMLATQHDLAGLISVVCQSREHWDRLLVQRAEDLVTCAFQGLMGRQPDPEALTTYTALLASTRAVDDLLSALTKSEEHWIRVRKLQTFRLRNPDEALQESALVFIHVRKTAGTSVMHMLADALGAESIFRENGHTLHLSCPAELSAYSVFAGHFNHDSLAYIPRRTLRPLTFVRDPRSRLLSYYRFLRAHEPTLNDFSQEVALANRLDVADFLGHHDIRASASFWNHTTWCIMGHNWWTRHLQVLPDCTRDQRARLLAAAREQIRRRLEDFAFIGVYEEFARSCEALFESLDLALPPLRSENSIEQLVARSSSFKFVGDVYRDPAHEALLDSFVELDDIVYDEAKALFRARHGAN